MNIAYLILAHNQPGQLLRLIDRLNEPHVHFFIHIDGKSKDTEAIRATLAGYGNVKIISEYKINWMGYKMVEGTLALMKLAWASGISFKYFVLMSGQDYPIKSQEHINNFFSENNCDFFSYNKISYLPDSFKNKMRHYHFYEIPYMNPRSTQKIPALVYLYFGLHKYITKFTQHRRFYKNWEPYFGSQWFALTQDTVKYILDYLETDKGYVQFMRTTEGPDETFFQTLILNSPRKENVYDYGRYTEWLKIRKEGEAFLQGFSSLRYMDWSERPGKTKPAVLDDTYFEMLAASKELYARKFDVKMSASLMDRIDNELLMANK